MLARLITTLRARFAELPGARVLVALSGGADSVALLHLLVAGRAELRIEPYAAHVNHHQRGAESDADASFCSRLCARLGVPIAVLDLDPAVPPGWSAEAWWRRERYRLLDQERDRIGAAAVLTAHTADDQAETVLLKLLRGAGPRGVAGVRRAAGHIARPLLDTRRAELRAYLEEHREGWREDASNADTRRPRAWLRHEILPGLEAAAPRLVDHLGAFADALAEDEELLASHVAGIPQPAPGAPVALALIAALPVALLRRWTLALADLLPLAEPPSRAQLLAVQAMVRGGRPAAVDLGRHWVLRRRGTRLHLSPPPLPDWRPVPVSVGSELELPGGFLARLGVARAQGHVLTLSAALLDHGACWRQLTPGERLNGRSICARLAQAGVPAEWRRAWPVLDAGGSIVCVPGVGVAQGSAGAELVAELEEPWQPRVRS